MRSIRKWLREPLLQFVLIGLALFVGDRVLNAGPERSRDTGRIEVTEGDLRQLEVAWTAQWRRPPTPEEMHSLVAARVREEIFYREALTLGLDKDDTIVKRRLAQKMEFLSEDVSGLREPAPDELRSWYGKHAERFALPGRRSFRHLYFSLDRRGARARDGAAQARERLAGAPVDDAGAARLADPFMFQDYYADRTPEQVAGVFGVSFADALFRLEPGAWQGPVESGLGWHLVWVTSQAPGRVPAFEEVEGAARIAWMDEQRAETRRRAFEAMAARYQVILPRPREASR
ncbi:MAG TPA: peptidylprolyl isomerase [Methylomirabilota bacterium]